MTIKQLVAALEHHRPQITMMLKAKYELQDIAYRPPKPREKVIFYDDTVDEAYQTMTLSLLRSGAYRRIRPDDDQAVYNFFFKCVERQLIDGWRHATRRRQVAQNWYAQRSLWSPDIAIRYEAYDQGQRVIATLPMRQRKVVELLSLGHTQSETAHILGIGKSAVNNHLKKIQETGVNFFA